MTHSVYIYITVFLRSLCLLGDDDVTRTIINNRTKLMTPPVYLRNRKGMYLTGHKIDNEREGEFFI